jgi:DNA end-binding protein Ku
MPARAIASGTIAFGLVSIPVKLYTATSTKDVHFHMVHAVDGGRLRQGYECRICGEKVERSATARGYEYTRDQFVVFSDEELKALESKSDQTIEIEQFVPISKVDPVYFEHSSLVGPDRGGSKAYHLLRDAMLQSQRVAVGRYHARGRQPLVLIRPAEDGLILHRLYYADEVRGFGDVDLGERTPTRDSELKLAKQLIEQLSSSRFDADQWSDEYRRSVLEAIDRKVAGEQVIAAPSEQPREKIIDLVAALKQSLAERGDEAGEPAAPRKAARKSSRKKSSKRETETG